MCVLAQLPTVQRDDTSHALGICPVTGSTPIVSSSKPSRVGSGATQTVTARSRTYWDCGGVVPEHPWLGLQEWGSEDTEHREEVVEAG